MVISCHQLSPVLLLIFLLYVFYFLNKISVLQGSGRAADVFARAYEETLGDERFAVYMVQYKAIQTSSNTLYYS